MMSYTDAENGKVALMQEILGVKDIQDIDLLYELHQEFMDAQKNAGTHRQTRAAPRKPRRPPWYTRFFRCLGF